MTTCELSKFAQLWEVALRAQGSPPNTVRAYTVTVRQLAAWQQDRGKTGFSREIVREFIAGILDAGCAVSTARLRMNALKVFSTWLNAEGFAGQDALAGLTAPPRGTTIVPKLSEEQLDALIAACNAERSVLGCRDEAIVRLAADAPTRCEEILGMTLPRDLDLRGRRASLRKTKGGKERLVPFSNGTKRAISRYLRMRGDLGIPSSGALWLSQRGVRLSYAGLYDSLGRRAAAAGIEGFHPHRLRHTAAVRWLQAGGTEGSLMIVGGWTQRCMINWYVADAHAELALAEGDRIFRSA